MVCAWMLCFTMHRGRLFCLFAAEWSEQQEDPNVEKLWEEDWDDDQVGAASWVFASGKHWPLHPCVLVYWQILIHVLTARNVFR